MVSLSRGVITGKSSVIFGIALAVLVFAPARAEEPFRVGVLQALSGVGETYGTVQEKAIRIAVAEINDAGGINGHPLELVVEDSKCNARDAITGYTKLTQVDGVKVIIGTSCSGAALGVVPLSQKDKVILISGSNTSPDLTLQGGDYYFRTAPSDKQIGIIGAKILFNDGHRKIAIINAATDPSEAINREVTRVFTELGGTVVASERHDVEMLEFRTLITKVLQANPDAIFLGQQDEAQAGILLKEIKELGFTGPVYCNDACTGTSALDIAGEAASGVVAIIPPFITPENTIGRDFLKKFRKEYGYTTLEYYMAAAYDATYLVADCFRKVGDDQNSEAIRSCLLDVENYTGAIGGPYSLGDDGDVIGITMVAVEILPVAERTNDNFGYRLRR